MSENYDHVVFPNVSTTLYRGRHERVLRTLNQIEAALGKEKRDLKREAAGQDPVEGVGTEVIAAAEAQAQVSDSNIAAGS
jgi:hypothetical protein